MRNAKSAQGTWHTAQWAHSSSESTVHTVGQRKPTDYLCEAEGARALRRRRGLGLGPVDAASRREGGGGVRNHIHTIVQVLHPFIRGPYSTQMLCRMLKVMLCWAFKHVWGFLDCLFSPRLLGKRDKRMKQRVEFVTLL